MKNSSVSGGSGKTPGAKVPESAQETENGWVWCYICARCYPRLDAVLHDDEKMCGYFPDCKGYLYPDGWHWPIVRARFAMMGEFLPEVPAFGIRYLSYISSRGTTRFGTYNYEHEHEREHNHEGDPTANIGSIEAILPRTGPTVGDRSLVNAPASISKSSASEVPVERADFTGASIPSAAKSERIEATRLDLADVQHPSHRFPGSAPTAAERPRRGTSTGWPRALLQAQGMKVRRVLPLVLMAVVLFGVLAVLNRTTSGVIKPTLPVPRELAEQFSYVGTIESIEGDTWWVNTLRFSIDPGTKVLGLPAVGASARVEGAVRADGTRVTQRIVILSSPYVSADLLTPGAPQATLSAVMMSVAQTPPPVTETTQASITVQAQANVPATSTLEPSLGTASPVRPANSSYTHVSATASASKTMNPSKSQVSVLPLRTTPSAFATRAYTPAIRATQTLSVWPTSTSRPSATHTPLSTRKIWPSRTTVPAVLTVPTKSPTRLPAPSVVAPTMLSPTATRIVAPTRIVEPTSTKTWSPMPTSTGVVAAATATHTPMPPWPTPTSVPPWPTATLPSPATRTSVPESTQPPARVASPTLSPTVTHEPPATREPRETPEVEPSATRSSQPSRTAQPVQTVPASRTPRPSETARPHETDEPTEEPDETRGWHPTHEPEETHVPDH